MKIVYPSHIAMIQIHVHYMMRESPLTSRPNLALILVTDLLNPAVRQLKNLIDKNDLSIRLMIFLIFRLVFKIWIVYSFLDPCELNPCEKRKTCVSGEEANEYRCVGKDHDLENGVFNM